MKHLGDVTKINGAEIEPVDVITFGAPCQDLSVAGKRAGMKSVLMGDSEEEETRSGLFFHSIRIIKEMREHDKSIRESDQLVRGTEYPPWLRPRWTVYENVKGALSSSGGCDFKAVIEQSIRVVEPEAPDLPMPEKGWPLDGVVYDPNGKWSIAWTVHDAQFFGVPQRRSRLVVLCDYGGLSACEVLSKCHPGSEPWVEQPVQSLGEGMSGDFVEGGTPRERVAGGTEAGPFAAS